MEKLKLLFAAGNHFKIAISTKSPQCSLRFNCVTLHPRISCCFSTTNPRDDIERRDFHSVRLLTVESWLLKSLRGSVVNLFPREVLQVLNLFPRHRSGIFLKQTLCCIFSQTLVQGPLMQLRVCIRKILRGTFNQLPREQIENSQDFPREQIQYTTPSSFQQIVPI